MCSEIEMRMNKIGMGLPNGPGYLDLVREIEFGVVLVIDAGAYADEQIRLVREWHPRTRIVVRRMGGLGTPPDRLAHDCAPRFADLKNRYGVVDWCFWNEPDRPEEGGHSAQVVADFARAFAPVARQVMPGIRLHWGAWSDEQRFQGLDPDIWLPVMREFYDVLDLHAYGPGYVRTFLQWAETFLPDKPNLITEFNPRPFDDAEQYVDAYRTAYEFSLNEGVCPFLLFWHGAETIYGDALNIAGSSAKEAAIRRAAAELPTLTPEPPTHAPELPTDAPVEVPIMPLTPDWISRNMTAEERWRHYQPRVWHYAGLHGVNADLATDLIWQESRFDPLARSSAGALGLMQLMPKTAESLGVSDPLDPEQNLDGGMRFLSWCLREFPGNAEAGVAAYNAGVTGVRTWIKQHPGNWRLALVTHRGDWPAKWGGAAKADQVATYLDKILGPMQLAPTPATVLDGVIDLRGQLPVLGWGEHYVRGSMDDVEAVTYHYTASNPGGSVRSIAEYQVSAAAAGQTGIKGQPFPGIAYTIVVKGEGSPHLCWDPEVVTWHAPGWNRKSRAVCFIGNGAPNADQIRGMARAHIYLERYKGAELGVRGHSDDYNTPCPGGWPRFKAQLVAAIEELRVSDREAKIPPNVPMSELEPLDAIFALAGDIYNGASDRPDLQEAALEIHRQVDRLKAS